MVGLGQLLVSHLHPTPANMPNNGPSVAAKLKKALANAGDSFPYDVFRSYFPTRPTKTYANSTWRTIQGHFEAAGFGALFEGYKNKFNAEVEKNIAQKAADKQAGNEELTGKYMLTGFYYFLLTLPQLRRCRPCSRCYW